MQNAQWKNRRKWLKQAGLATAGLLFFENIKASALMPKPVILLRSGWQIENIGDIAHTPGFLALLKKYIPNASAIFWPHYHYLPKYESDMLKKHFPDLDIIEGSIVNGKPSNTALAKAFKKADVFINNSGPATLGYAEALAFKKLTGKPYGVYGVTYGLYGKPETEMLKGADFVYFRDSVSLQKAKDDKVNARVTAFGPDAAFATNIRNDEAALALLKQKNLEPSKFLCCIPKHRHTPTWFHELKNRPFNAERHARNEEMKEHDHAPMREAITEVIRQTDLKIFICHEDITEMIIGKEWILDRLPDDVKPKVAWLDRPWLPDEAISVYIHSAGHFGHEMHSPIMCIGNGVPAIVGRWEEQSSKGIMWRDIGLEEWLFDFDNESDIKRYVPTVLAMAKDPGTAKLKVENARKLLQIHQKNSMAVVEDALNNRSKILK